MSPLQIGLLVIAVVAVAAVYLYNLFEERRVQRRIDGAFQKPEDVLLTPRSGAAPRREPSLAPALPATDQEVVVTVSPEAQAEAQTEADAADSPEPEPQVESEPALTVETIDIPPLSEEDPTAASENAVGPAGAAVGGSDPDGVIECLAYFSFAEPVAVNAFFAACPAELLPTLSWYGRGAKAGPWRFLSADDGTVCGEVAAGLLLANRQGPVSRALLRGFLEAMNELARVGEATLMVPEAGAEMARADALDKACSVVDVQIGLTLLRREGALLAGTRLRGVAEGAGFRLNPRGGFDYLHEESGKLMFELVDVGGRPLTAEGLKSMQIAGVTLLLDVPRIHEPLKAFDQMRAVARRLAITLEATLVDDGRRPLPEAALAAIRTQLQQTCAAMRDMDVEPGGARALRLFT